MNNCYSAHVHVAVTSSARYFEADKIESKLEIREPKYCELSSTSPKSSKQFISVINLQLFVSVCHKRPSPGLGLRFAVVTHQLHSEKEFEKVSLVKRLLISNCF